MADVTTGPSMHVIVMTGVVRMVRAFHAAQKENRPFSIGDACGIGAEGVTDDMASLFICEFAKDGLLSLTGPDIERAMAGDYSQLWRTTNHFLTYFGHARIEPVPLTP